MTYTNREISEKKQLFIGNLHCDTTEENLYKFLVYNRRNISSKTA